MARLNQFSRLARAPRGKRPNPHGDAVAAAYQSGLAKFARENGYVSRDGSPLIYSAKDRRRVERAMNRVRSNPPRPRRARVGKLRAKTRARTTRPARLVVRGTKLGRPVELVYRHTDGKLYRHKFSGGTVGFAGGYLFIGPVAAKVFIS